MAHQPPTGPLFCFHHAAIGLFACSILQRSEARSMHKGDHQAAGRRLQGLRCKQRAHVPKKRTYLACVASGTLGGP